MRWIANLVCTRRTQPGSWLTHQPTSADRPHTRGRNVLNGPHGRCMLFPLHGAAPCARTIAPHSYEHTHMTYQVKRGLTHEARGSRVRVEGGGCGVAVGFRFRYGDAALSWRALTSLHPSCDSLMTFLTGLLRPFRFYTRVSFIRAPRIERQKDTLPAPTRRESCSSNTAPHAEASQVPQVDVHARTFAHSTMRWMPVS